MQVGTRLQPEESDPQARFSITESWPQAGLYAQLIRRGYPNQLENEGEVAKSWDISDDYREYVFDLYAEASWHDGTPLTAHDVEYMFLRGMAPPEVSPSVVTPPCTARSSRSRSSTTRPFGSFWRSPAHGSSTTSRRPGSAWPTHATSSRARSRSSRPTSATWAAGRSSSRNTARAPTSRSSATTATGSPTRTAKASRTSTACGTTRPTIPRSSSNGSPSESSTSARATGWYILKPQQEQLASRFGDDVQFDEFLGNNGVMVGNPKRVPALADKRVRQAMQLWIDRAGAVQVIDQGAGTVAGFYPEGIDMASDWASEPGFRAEKDADREEAQRLMAEAGFGSTRISGSLVVREDWAHIAEYVVSDLRDLGFDITLAIGDTPSTVTQFLEDQWDFYVFQYFEFLAPIDIRRTFHSSVRASLTRGWNGTPEQVALDEILDRTVRGTDLDAQKAAATEGDRYIHIDECLAWPVQLSLFQQARRSYVQGVRLPQANQGVQIEQTHTWLTNA